MKYFAILIVAIACASAMSVRDAEEQPQALQGYFDTLIEIYSKLKQLGMFKYISQVQFKV